MLKKIMIIVMVFGLTAVETKAAIDIAHIKKVTEYKPSTTEDMLSGKAQVSRASIYRALAKEINESGLPANTKAAIEKLKNDIKEKLAKNPDEIMSLPYSLRNVTMRWTEQNKEALRTIFDSLEYLISFVLYDNNTKAVWEKELKNKLNEWRTEVNKTLE